jgi:hypothetical protein
MFRTRSVTSNILAQQRRRNGTETWRRSSCQCEHLRLITHEKILLKGDFPWRNGNVTYVVQQRVHFLNPLHCRTEKPVSFLLASTSVLSTHTASWLYRFCLPPYIAMRRHVRTSDLIIWIPTAVHSLFFILICNCLLGILLKLNPYQYHRRHWLVTTVYASRVKQ